MREREKANVQERTRDKQVKYMFKEEHILEHQVSLT